MFTGILDAIEEFPFIVTLGIPLNSCNGAAT